MPLLLRINCTLLLSFFLVCTQLHAATIEENSRIVGLKLLSVSYAEAVIEVEYAHAEELKGEYGFKLVAFEAGLLAESPLQRVTHNQKKYQIVVSRGLQKPHPFTSNTIWTVVKFNGKSKEQTFDFKINWPGPEYLQEILEGSSTVKNNDPSLKGIFISREVSGHSEIYRSLLEHGIPIHKIGLTGPKQPADRKLAITIGYRVAPSLSKQIVAISLSNSSTIDRVILSKQVRDLIIIGDLNKSVGQKLSKEDLEALKWANLGDQEFARILGYKSDPTAINIDELYNRAYRLLDTNQRENIERAKVMLDTILEHNPNFPRAYLELARYYMKSPSGLNSEVLARAERSILVAKEIDPNLADTLVLLGYVYTHQGRFSEAEQQYREAERLGTDNLWLYANWAQNYQHQGQIDEAIEMYLKVANTPRKHDRNDRVKKNTYHYLPGLLVNVKRYDEADRYYGHFAKEFPLMYCSYQRQAEVRLFLKGNYKGAINSALKASKLGCRQPSHTLSIAHYLKWHNTTGSESSAAFRRAEGTAPADMELMATLAMYEVTADLIPKLIDNGHNINATNVEGVSALTALVQAGHLPAIGRLLSNGANINQLDEKGQVSPFIMAVITGNLDAVRLMLPYRPDLNRVLPNGQSLVEWARANNQMEIASLLAQPH